MDAKRYYFTIRGSAFASSQEEAVRMFTGELADQAKRGTLEEEYDSREGIIKTRATITHE